VRKLSPVPKEIIELMCSGGIFPLLEKQGLIAPLLPKNGKSEVMTA
jgi:hypothetical protein